MKACERGIGDLLFRIREEKGMTLAQISKGLCSVAQMGKIEQNELTPDYFLLDRLFSRLGKSTEQLEYVLPMESYELYEIQYLIQMNICHMEFEKAEQMIEEYRRKKQADRPLHQQYIYQEKAQIAWLRNEDSKKVLGYLNKAILETMPQEKATEDGMALSAEELKLLLFRWEVCFYLEEKRPKRELEKILLYINQSKMDMAEMVKVYPYAVLLMGSACEYKENFGILEAMTRKALSILRETGKILYMPEILEQYAQLMVYIHGDGAFIQMLRSERESLLAIEAEYQFSLEKYRLFQHTIRRFEIDAELLRKTREAVGMTQEELSEGICTPETLSRIESGRRRPRDKKMYEMMERLERKRERVGTLITTDEYEVLNLKRYFARALLRLDYGKAEEILAELEERLDCTAVNNKQYIQTEKVKIMYAKKAWGAEKCLEELKRAFQMTLHGEEEQWRKHEFTVEENSILNEMALIYYDAQKWNMAIQILQMQLQKFGHSIVKPIFHILEWELAIGNLAHALEETHQINEAVKACKIRIKNSLEAGKGNTLGRSAIIIAGALEQQKSDACVRYFVYGMDLLKLFKIESRYQIMCEYINEPGFQYKEDVNHFRNQFHHQCEAVDKKE